MKIDGMNELIFTGTFVSRLIDQIPGFHFHNGTVLGSIFGSIGNLSNADTVFTRDVGFGIGVADTFVKVSHFGGIGLMVALREREERVVRGDAIGGGDDARGGGAIFGLNHALVSVDFEPLVVAVEGRARDIDKADDAVGKLE